MSTGLPTRRASTNIRLTKTNRAARPCTSRMTMYRDILNASPHELHTNSRPQADNTGPTTLVCIAADLCTEEPAEPFRQQRWQGSRPFGDEDDLVPLAAVCAPSPQTGCGTLSRDLRTRLAVPSPPPRAHMPLCLAGD